MVGLNDAYMRLLNLSFHKSSFQVMGTKKPRRLAGRFVLERLLILSLREVCNFYMVAMIERNRSASQNASSEASSLKVRSAVAERVALANAKFATIFVNPASTILQIGTGPRFSDPSNTTNKL